MTFYVVRVDAIERAKKLTSADAESAYIRQHTACPACGNRWDISQTCMGMIDYQPDDPRYRDRNIAKCPCGWQGIVHDLLPEST